MLTLRAASLRDRARCSPVAKGSSLALRGAAVRLVEARGAALSLSTSSGTCEPKRMLRT
jgi:hypothetical protein